MKANGTLLRATRMEQGHSLSGLARTVGIDKGTLSRVEREQEGLSPERMLRLSTLLDLPMDRLAPEIAQLKNKAEAS